MNLQLSIFNFKFLVCSVVGQALGELDDSGSAQAVGSQFDELLSILQGGDAAGGLDLHMGGNMLGEQLHIGKGSAGGGEAGGGLDIVGAGVGHALAQGDLLLIGQQTGLDDDLQDAAHAMFLDLMDLLGDLGPLAFLGPADVDDHIHFVSTVTDGIMGHEALGGGGGIAVGEADNGANSQLFAHIFLGLLHEGSGDADGSGGILHTIVADGLDVSPGSGLSQQGVVAFCKNFRKLHNIVLLLNVIRN